MFTISGSEEIHRTVDEVFKFAGYSTSRTHSVACHAR